jgi:hypothetical protein
MEYYGLSPKACAGARQFEIELKMLSLPDLARVGGLSREEHYKNVIRILWPNYWKGWNDWSELMLWAYCNYPEIGMTGCAAATKTFHFSLFPAIDFMSRPSQTRITLTSTTLPSLRSRIWNELINHYKKSRLPVISSWGFNHIDSKLIIQFRKGEDKAAIKGVAVQSGDIEQAVGNIQGVHLPRVVVVVDEAAQTPSAIFSARANLQTGAEYFRFVAIANASNAFDAHGKYCEPVNGWSSISVEDESWETRSGICLHFDGLKSPNIKAGRTMFPYMFDTANIETIRRNHGENSMEWWSYVRGFWPPSGVRNTVLDAALIHQGAAKEKCLWGDGRVRTVAALDPAFTTDGDKPCLMIGKIGRNTAGADILEETECIGLKLEARVDYPLYYQLADKVRDELISRKIQPEDFIMDVTGGGAGAADILEQRWKSGFHRISFGGSAEDRNVSNEDRKTGKEVYANRVTQIWFQVFTLVSAGAIRGMDDESAKQFCTRLYALKGERKCVESKKDMKTRISGQSPDEADAFSLLAELFYIQVGVPGVTSTTKDDPNAWERLARKYEIRHDYSAN